MSCSGEKEFCEPALPNDDKRAAFTVEDCNAGIRLDRFLSQQIETLSRARLQELIRTGYVELGGQAATDPAAKIKSGQRYTLTMPAISQPQTEAQALDLSIVYEDETLIVIDKQAGLVVHPGAGNPGNTLVNALLAHCGSSLSGIGGVARPGIVHRLDKDTSGLIVIAKTDVAHRHLAQQFADHGRTGDLRREYIAIVWNSPRQPYGRVETLIARHPTSRIKMAVVKANGRIAITHYAVEQVYSSSLLGLNKSSSREKVSAIASRIRCTLETGRTHQVRVHMAHIGVPIIGDATYGAGFYTKINAIPELVAGGEGLIKRQALHAAKLCFRHPRTKRLLSFESELPQDMTKLISRLEGLGTKLSKN